MRYKRINGDRIGGAAKLVAEGSTEKAEGKVQSAVGARDTLTK
jgi:uncharacterized protein YjbJ (UPF0337 family)